MQGQQGARRGPWRGGQAVDGYDYITKWSRRAHKGYFLRAAARSRKRLFGPAVTRAEKNLSAILTNAPLCA